MKPLVDGDILRYEIGFSAEIIDSETNEPRTMDFERCSQLFDEKIKLICEDVNATEEPVIYLTDDKYINRQVNQLRKTLGEDKVELVPNFRDEIAITKAYKANRKSKKPDHFDNLTAYILGMYKHEIARGYEADDLMAIHQTLRNNHNEGCAFGIGEETTTIICSRDKDLRQVPGWHYSWECGKQPSIGPVYVEQLGWLEKSGDKIIGYGDKFFFFQLLTGDVVDNIPGLPKYGKVKAFKLLEDVKSSKECLDIVTLHYRDVMGNKWKSYLREQANLLWMVRELDDKGKPVMFNPKNFK